MAPYSSSLDRLVPGYEDEHGDMDDMYNISTLLSLLKQENIIKIFFSYLDCCLHVLLLGICHCIS